MQDLWLASLFFVGTHLGIPSSPLREQLIQLVGERVYRLLYSLIAFVGLFWLIAAYRNAPWIPLWESGTGLRHLALGVMPLALLLAVCGLTAPNPMAMGQRPDADAAEPATGIQRITRHPFLWGVLLWAVLHLLVSGHLAGLVLFGSFALLAGLGTVLLDHRRMREGGPGWGVYLQRTSNVPLWAVLHGRQKLALREIGWWRPVLALVVYGLLVLGHGWLVGRPLV